MKLPGWRHLFDFQWQRLGLALSVLAGGVGLTLAGWGLTRQWIAAEERATLESRVEGLHGVMVRRVALYDQALHATAAFIRVAAPVGLDEWADFVDRLSLADNFPGIPALAYAPLLRRDQAAAFIEGARADGLEGFRIWPQGDNELMVPNRFSAPINDANKRALGYDMYQDPVRRSTMDAARDSGRTAITAKVTLTIDAGRNAESAFIAYAPIYGKDLPTDTVEQRRAALRGFTLAPVRVPTLVSQVIQMAAPEAEVRLYDGPEVSREAEMYVSDGARAVTAWLRRDIAFSNRTWTVFYGFRAGVERPQDRVLPWLVALLGGSVSVLLSLLVGNLVNARGNALALAADMTRALRESEAKFRAVFDNSVQYQSLLTADGRLVAANPTALALVGGELSRIEGKPFWEIEWLDVPAERERCREALAETARGRWTNLEVLRHNPAGEAMWVDMSFRPVWGEDGTVGWIVAEGRDLTERRQREEALNRAVAELTRSNQELERFAHIAAHDLQEPCRTIISYAQLLERRSEPVLDEASHEFLGYLVSGAHRMRDLVTDLLAYSRARGKEAPFEPVDCGQVVAGVLADLQRSIAEAGALVEVGELPVVSGDRAQLTQLFLNLIGNALKFRDPARPAHIRIWADRDDGDWLFRVADNGIGIAPAYHQRVFEIFQRLHGPDRYPGTGIGLAICRKVVERHSGRIWVESLEGQGACFCFTLPAAG